MSWSMPPQGSWPSGVAMTPDMMNVGSYTPEQWAAMQQNWQQWAQWQQQYAQWQNQYGEKYAAQMQGMQAAGVPCPPTSAPPPAPPPPDNPPPPHENDQPLYASAPPPVPAPAPARASDSSNLTSVNVAAGNAQPPWSYDAPPPTPINSDALKKLAEEEKLFDIQFQKWEEEIEKWRKENVNHPDKAAYKEYEQKFETCRAQLLERRQQMKQKRARLMTNAPNAANTPVSGKIPPAAPPPLHTPSQGYDQSQGYGQKSNQTYNQDKPQNYNQNQPKNFNQNQPHNYNSRQDYQSQQNYNKNQNQNYSNPNASSYQQYNAPSGGYNRGNRGNIDPQDRYESYDYANNDYFANDDYSANDNYSPNENYPPEKSTFLPTSGAPKSIPGLDLVPDSDKAPAQQQDVIDITDDNAEKNLPVKGPDYTTISKGINNILGDEKIMNILSRVAFNTPAGNAAQNNSGPPLGMGNNNGPQPGMGPNNGPPPGMGPNNGPPPGMGPNNGPPPGMGPNNGPPPGMGQNKGFPPGMGQNSGPPGMGHNSGPPGMGHNSGPPGMGQNSGPPGMGHNSGPPGMGHNSGPPGMGHNNGPPGMGYNNQNMPPNNQWNRNDGYNNQQQQFGNRQNYPMQQNQDQNRFPPNQRQMYDERQGNDGQDMYYDRNSQYGGPNMPPRTDQGPRQNAPGPRPLMDLHIPPNMNNDFSRGPQNRSMPPNMAPQNPPPPPPRPKWMDEMLFTPSLVVEYEHKPLRLKAREFIEPVHMFDYDHKSKDGENKKKDFEREVDDLFTRKPRRDRDNNLRAPDRYDMPERQRERDGYNRDFEGRVPREDLRDDYRQRPPPREEFDDRRRPDDRYDDRRRDERDRDIRDRFGRREDSFRDRERERDRDRERERDRDKDRDMFRDRMSRDHRRDEPRNRSRSRDRDSRKRGHSRDLSEATDVSKKSRDNKSAEKSTNAPKHVVMIDDILEAPGREMRPEKIVIILRGPPGSGKSYLAKLIRDREAEYGGTARIMSIDDYFMQEGEVEEKDPTTGKTIKKPTLKYEYDEAQEESYLNSLKRAFKRSLTDGYFTFLIYDAVNDHLRSYADVWNFARQNGFQVYVCTMELDAQVCHKRNIHNRSLSDIQVIVSRFFPTPSHHIQLDATTLLQNASIPEVQMEDADDEVVMEDVLPEVETSFTSKWEKMDDAAQLAKLDGTNKPLRPSQLSMEDYLQLDEWTPNKAKPGKKTVRWADIEERRQQEKMRAIGFVVGQTDWNRMTDPTMGSSALTQTKYIERVRRT